MAKKRVTASMREERRRAAEDRALERSKLSLEEMLLACDMKPGACKQERERLQAAIIARNRGVVSQKEKGKKHA